MLALAASAFLYRTFFILHANADDGFAEFLLALAGLPFAAALGTTVVMSLFSLVNMIPPARKRSSDVRPIGGSADPR